MKRIICLFFVLIMIFTLCACGGGNTSNKMTPEKAICDEVEWKVQFQLMMSGYKVQSVDITTILEVSDNEFEFYGIYYILDVYDQKYKGRFDGTATYYPEDESVSTRINIE